MLTIILVSCSQEENVESQKAIVKIENLKSKRATTDARGNLIIDNQTDLDLDIDLYNYVLINLPLNDESDEHKRLYINFKMPAHLTETITDMTAPSIFNGSSGWQLIDDDLNTITPIDPVDALANFGFFKSVDPSNPNPTKITKWGRIKNHMIGRIKNPHVTGDDFRLEEYMGFDLGVNFPKFTGDFQPYTQSIGTGFAFAYSQLHVTVNCTVDANGDTHLTITQLLNAFI